MQKIDGKIVVILLISSHVEIIDTSVTGGEKRLQIVVGKSLSSSSSFSLISGKFASEWHRRSIA